MKYTRIHSNEAKTYLSSAHKKIKNVFEGIETPEHYNAFYNMCNSVLNYCKTWDDRLRPFGYNRWFSFCIKPFTKKKIDIYESYVSFALDTVSKLNEMIDNYISAETAANEYAKKYAEAEERIRMERDIVDMLNKEKDEELKKETKKIGFTQYSQTCQKKKRKYTKKKKDEI